MFQGVNIFVGGISLEVEINIEESRAILSALKFLVRLPHFLSSFVHCVLFLFSHRLDSSCARRLTRARDTVSQYLDRGSRDPFSTARRFDRRTTPWPRFLLPLSFSLSLSLCTDRSRYRREEERAQSFFSRWPLSRFRSSAGIRNSSSSSPSIRDPSDPIAANCDLFLSEVSPSSFLPVEEEDEMDEINARNADTSSFE